MRKVPNEEEEEDDDQSFGELGREHKDFALHNTNREKLYSSLARRPKDNQILGGSCQNLSTCRRDGVAPFKVQMRSCSLEGIADVSYSEMSSSPDACSPVSLTRNLPPSDEQGVNCASVAPSESHAQAPLRHNPEVTHGPDGRTLLRSQSVGDCLGSCSSINTPVAEITIKPGQTGQGRLQKRLSTIEGSEAADPGVTVTKRLCQSSMELASSPPSISPALHASQPCTGTQSKVNPIYCMSVSW